MAVLKPFKGLRPPVELASKVASRPYDVLNSEEAREEAKGNPYTLLHIIKPEIDFPAGTDEHSEPVYQKAAENLDIWRNNEWLVKDVKDSLYIYAQTMEGRTQYGIVGCASVDDYLKGVIKKHELTRADKEEDRMKHVRITNANMEPVFFAYPAVKELDDIVADIVAKQLPVYDFVAEDGFGHHFWLVDNDQTIDKIVKLFAKIPATYVADGHHRTAAAALVGKEKRAENPNHTGDEEYNYFLAVHFPDNQLKIIDYNRTVKDLNGLSATALIDKIGEDFEIQKMGTEIYKPDQLHTFSMYLKGEWYKLVTNTGCYNDNDPIGVLDVTILSNLILDNILGIKDLRSD